MNYMLNGEKSDDQGSEDDFNGNGEVMNIAVVIVCCSAVAWLVYRVCKHLCEKVERETGQETLESSSNIYVAPSGLNGSFFDPSEPSEFDSGSETPNPDDVESDASDPRSCWGCG